MANLDDPDEFGPDEWIDEDGPMEPEGHAVAGQERVTAEPSGTQLYEPDTCPDGPDCVFHDLRHVHPTGAAEGHERSDRG